MVGELETSSDWGVQKESVRWLSREGWLDGKEFAKICGLGSRLAK